MTYPWDTWLHEDLALSASTRPKPHLTSNPHASKAPIQSGMQKHIHLQMVKTLTTVCGKDRSSSNIPLCCWLKVLLYISSRSNCASSSSNISRMACLALFIIAILSLWRSTLQYDLSPPTYTEKWLGVGWRRFSVKNIMIRTTSVLTTWSPSYRRQTNAGSGLGSLRGNRCKSRVAVEERRLAPCHLSLAVAVDLKHGSVIQ